MELSLDTQKRGVASCHSSGRSSLFSIDRIAYMLESPVYIAAVRFVEGRFRICWATEGFPSVTGYTVEELNAAGGWIALVRHAMSEGDLETVVGRLLSGDTIREEMDILTRLGRRRRVRCLAGPPF